MNRARFDLHLHTEYSPDCDTSIRAIEPHCVAHGLSGIAVTDHNTIEGALRLRDRVKSIDVIVGEEVSTRDGDVIGLFLSRRIAPKMSAADTMAAIHEQGGLVYVPHPFDRSRTVRKPAASLSALANMIDIIEVFNGKVARDSYNEAALEFAVRHGKIGAGGSDAHTLRAIGGVTTEIDRPDNWTDPQSFLERLRTAKVSGTRRSPIGGWFVLGRRPLVMAWRRMRRDD